MLGAERKEPLSRAPGPDCSLFSESPPGPRRKLRLPLRLHPHHVHSRLREIRSQTASQSQLLTPCSSPCSWRAAPLPKRLQPPHLTLKQPLPPTSARRGPPLEPPRVVASGRGPASVRAGYPARASWSRSRVAGQPFKGPAADKLRRRRGAGGPGLRGALRGEEETPPPTLGFHPVLRGASPTY